MSAFYDLSAVSRAMFALWTLLLCLINVISLMLSAGKKRFAFSALALLFFAPVYTIWQVIFDLSLSKKTDMVPSAFSLKLGQIPWIWWLVAAVISSVATVLLLIYNLRYEKNFITPGSIKTFLDKTPCGVCCWRDNGRVLFSNICMNRLCVALTASPLLNGNQFYEAVADGIKSVDGKLWRFSRRDIMIGGEKMYEMIASDVTTEYAKTQALEKDKAELSRLNKELKEYTLSIDETVRHQEILQAKVNIHDEMNRLMLSTVSAESEDAATLDNIFSLWEQNALLLCMEAEKMADKKAVSRIEELADALKIRLSRFDELPASLSEDGRALFFFAAQEAIANAAKHAEAKQMEICVLENENEIICRFVNDGNMPANEVVFSGGLTNLVRLAEGQGATVSAAADEKFTLSLIFEKNKPNG